MGKYFGDDGYRGEGNVGISPLQVYKIGRFLGWHSRRGASGGKDVRPRIAVGTDTRRSGGMLASALVSGLTASGADTYLLHVISTPGIAFITKKDCFSYGVMITASHNPYYDNGVKIFTAEGEKADRELLNQVEACMDRPSDTFDWNDAMPLATRGDIGRVVSYEEGREAYRAFLLSQIEAPCALKIALDCSHGSASEYAESVFGRITPHLRILNALPDGLNINRGCGAVHIEYLQSFVQENGYDLGFAFDGDADRCVAIDEAGHVLDGDQILYILARYLKSRGALKGNTVVGTLMTNIGLVHSLEEAGIRCELAPVGDRAVYQRMKEKDYALGGENVGHVIFRGCATTGDGMLSAIMLLNAIAYSGSTLSALGSGMKKYPHICRNVLTEHKQAVAESALVKQTAAEVEKKIGNTGRVVLRPSGIENIVRVMVECESLELCEQYAREIEAACRQALRSLV